MEGLDIQITDKGRILVCAKDEKHALAVFKAFCSPAYVLVDNRTSTFYVSNEEVGIVRNFEYVLKSK